jgi:hypothetical protein
MGVRQQHDHNNIVQQEKGGYVTHHDRLLGSIARQLWPLLGITAPVADALWAWVHFREVRPPVHSALRAAAKVMRRLRGYATLHTHTSACLWQSRQQSFFPHKRMPLAKKAPGETAHSVAYVTQRRHCCC